MSARELHHEHFEELCALAALGQISPEEHLELQSHLPVCATCRARQADFTEILHEHLPLLDSQEVSFAQGSNIAFHDASYKQRFIQRAQEEGIHFSDEILGKRSTPKNVQRSWRGLSWVWRPQRLAYSAAVLTLGIWIGILSTRNPKFEPVKNKPEARLAQLQDEISRLRQRIVELTETASAAKVAEPAPIPLQPPASSRELLQSELTRIRQDYASAVAKSQNLDGQLQNASTELAVLKEKLDQSANDAASSTTRVVFDIQQQAGVDLPTKLRETELALKQTSEALEKLQRERGVYASTFADQQAQIRELMEKIGTQSEALQRERELNGAAHDIRGMMGARNLHIIDVADLDIRGAQKPFGGRVFYTEGKSLIFYAYDLGKRNKSLEKYSFQAWGQKEAKNGSARSLGVFVNDDQAQNRWVLKCDDPAILAQIDAVFVTIEPKGGSERPQGQQLMYAYLRATPNHP